MFNLQIKERLDFILLCLLLIHQALSHHSPSHSTDDEVTWNGWPDTKDISEITALVDYTTGLVFYKDTSVPACFVENHQPHSHSLTHTPSTLPKVLSVSSKLHRISNSDEWANSEYKEQFCGSLPIFKIHTLDEKKLIRLPRKKRQASGGSVSGSQAQASQWPSSSQTQVQGSVSGQGFFSGQAQAAHGGYSQSQVQLGGQGITGNLQSSAGNAQSQLSLGEHGGAGQASSFGVGPSSSQVQVNLGQREQGSHASANVFQQHAYDQGEYSKLSGNGYGGRQRAPSYTASGYGNGQSQAPPQDYRQQPGSTFSGQPLNGHGSGRNGYPSSGQLPGYSPQQYPVQQQPQHTIYSNDISSAHYPEPISGYVGQGLSGGGLAPSVPLQGQPQGSGYEHGVPLSGSQGGHSQTGGLGKTIPQTTLPIQGPQQQPLTGNGYTQTSPAVTQQFPSGSGINGNVRGTGAGLHGGNGQQTYYPQPQPQLGGQRPYSQQTPSGTSLGGQDHSAGPGTYNSYPSTSGRDTGSGRQNQNQGVYINSNVQPLNGHGVGQQSTQNGDHRRRHGNGAYARGGSSHYGASAGAGTGYGAYATAPGGQAQAQSLHIGSFGLGTNGQHDYRKTPYYSTAPQSSQVPSSNGQDSSLGGSGYTNGYAHRSPGQVNGLQQPAQTGQTTTTHGGGTNGHHAVDQPQSGGTIIDQEHHARQNGNGAHGTQSQQPTRTNGNGHHGITQQTPVRTNGNGHHGRANGNGHHGNTQQAPVRTNGNGHHGITQQAPVRTNGNGHHGITQQAPVRTNGNGHHGITQQQPVRTNGNGQGYGTTSTNGNGKVGNGYRNGHSISVNGYSSGNGHRTNGYVPQHLQPHYTQRQGGTNGNGQNYGTSPSSTPLKTQPQCTVITFTCTIVIESNGRAKLCRPKTSTNGGNGNGGGAASGTDQQTVCCC